MFSLEEPDTSRWSECLEGFSRVRRETDSPKLRAKLMKLVSEPWLSCPETTAEGILSVVSRAAPRTRLRGLCGEARVREKVLAVDLGLADRTDSFTPDLEGVLSRLGCAVKFAKRWGDGGLVVWVDPALDRPGDGGVVVVVPGPASATEASGLRRLNFDGERDKERRKDRTAADMSTWCTCVGDGSVSVPPHLSEYAILHSISSLFAAAPLK